MKTYKLFLLIFLNFLFIPVFATEEIPVIKSVTYEGNLSSDTIIKIQGSFLNNCENLEIDSKKIDLISNTETLLTFNFGDLQKYNGSIVLQCGDETLKNYFSFPHITKITGLDDNSSEKYITVSGENFGFDPRVVLEGGSFDYGIKQNTIITGTIPVDIDGNEIYISVNGLESNIFKLDVKIPEIKFVYSKNNFYKNSEITIFGNYLNYYKKTKVIFGDKEITDFEYNYDGSIVISSNSKLGIQELYVESNGFISNSIELDIVGDLPFISKINKKNTSIEVNGEYIDMDVISINGENFPGYIDDIDVTNNGLNISILSKSGDNLFIDESVLKGGDNFFQINVNGKYSNVINFYNDFDLPSIGGFEFGGIEDNLREIKVYLNNFDESNDKIYINGSINNTVSCYLNTCKLNISDSILSGTISVGNGENINPDYKEFDISFDNYPYIDYVYIKGDLKQGTKVEIVGQNFSDATGTYTNLFDKDSKGNYDIKIGSYKIEGTLPFSYDPTISSKINIAKYGQTSTIDFIGANLNSKKIYGSPIISNLTSKSNDGLFKSGKIVEMKGKGFKSGDQIVFGKIKTPVEVIDGSNGTFIIPTGISEGKINVYIENKDLIKSNVYEVIIVPDYYEANLIINSEKISKNIVNLGEGLNLEVFKLSLSNKIKDLIVDEIKFNVSPIDGISELGTFDLKFGGKSVGTSLVDEDGILTFGTDFLIEKSFTDYSLSLVKNSLHNKNGSYKVSFLEGGIKVIDKKSKDLFSDISIGDIYSNTIKVVDKNLINCIDISSDYLNCNKFISTGILLNNSSNEDINTSASENITVDEVTKEDIVIDNKTEEKSNIELKGITQYDFKSKTYIKLNKSLDSYILKLSKKSKYKDKILEIEDKVNDIIKDIYLYEKYIDNKMKRTVMKKKLYKDATIFKELLK